MAAPKAPEFSRTVTISDLSPEGRTFRVSASPEECAALALRFGLVGLDNLEVEGRLEPADAGEGVRLQAHLTADVVQSCVVTLDPVPSRIESSFARLYTRAVEDEWADDASEGIGSEEAFPEPLVAGSVDVGEAAAQQLALDLDPFPKAPYAIDAMPALEAGDEGALPPGPFAKLSVLKSRLGGDT